MYRVDLDGGNLTRLSERPRTHTARFSPGLTWYIDTWSNVDTPIQVRLHGADGDERRASSTDDGRDELPLAPRVLSKPAHCLRKPVHRDRMVPGTTSQAATPPARERCPHRYRRYTCRREWANRSPAEK